MRVALVHDWLVGRRGGEAVLEALVRLFPSAEIFTLLHSPGSVPGAPIETRPIHVSPLQRVPGCVSALPQPLAVHALGGASASTCAGLTSSSPPATAWPRGCRVPTGTPHLAYVFAPMRYMWDLFDEYFGPGRAAWPVRLAARALRPSLQAWDRATAQAPDVMLADSQHVARRIARDWGREVEVVYPAVDVERFASGPLGKGAGGYFLWVGALAPYKRLDVALEAFRRLGAPLWVAGDGQDESPACGGAPEERPLAGGGEGRGAAGALPWRAGPGLSRGGGLRHRPAGGDGLRATGAGAGPGWCAGDSHARDGRLLRRANARGAAAGGAGL